MRKIYVDINNYCHTTNPDGNYQEVETDFFDGKCDVVVEGYRYKITENGAYIYPWKSDSELEKTQRAYERQQLAEYEAALSEIETALGVTS